ncbi:hypothetical protein RHGRI_006166 [Rhododendron griersonianum]|uniref:Reverse transcriptase zinc-binding domain-containing protein n=1 Tax=Rhododendron griersonianum TaxID=479676 RepID=A0AAV6LFR7_9ERIC|nr:hypothetical protein RHGRI_006166 [Rhododendron griersonianum]
MEEDEDMWKRVWYMRAPTKIKMFLWRCLHEIIPVNRVLTHRHMPVDPICPLCGLAEETPSHMLLNCVRASKVWVLSPLQVRPELVETRIMEEALDEFNLFLQATKTNQSCSQRAILESRPLWVPPDPGVLKINVDGVFAARTRKGGVGVVLHDFEGKILGATAVPMHE